MKQFVIKVNIEEESLTDQFDLAAELLKALNGVNRKFQILSARFEEEKVVNFPVHHSGCRAGSGSRAMCTCPNTGIFRNEQRDGTGTSTRSAVPDIHDSE